MPEHENRIHEDVHTTAVSAVGIAVLGVIGLVLLAAYLLVTVWHAHVNGANAPLDARPADPVLESAPQTDRAQYAAEKKKLLESYGWVEPQQGIARIPIERAMALLVARGNATRGGGKPQ
ncbi:MAG TPA: hypothetical protein VLN59_01150 [Burkholderiales bacterium]|nr:hypothetical protein [Burkholderiales bacterium]